MRKILLIFLLFCAFNTKAQNLIINGSFEINNPISTYPCVSISDGNFSNITDYGAGTIAFIKDSCAICPSQTFWGGGAQDGHWFVEMASDFFPQIMGHKLSFDILTPLDSMKNYKLSFWIKKPPPSPSDCLDAKNNYINLGVSNYNNLFGSHIYTSPLGDSIWTQHSIVFKAQNNEEYLTIEVGTGDSSNHVVFIDNFVLVETEEPVSVQEQYNKKQLLRIVDVLGRETPYKKNTPLFYLYDDGTVEKKIFVE